MGLIMFYDEFPTKIFEPQKMPTWAKTLYELIRLNTQLMRTLSLRILIFSLC